MKFGIHILGSGTCVPSVRRAPSGYLMNLNDVYYLFDGGSGTLRQIAAINFDYRLIETIFYTHLHVDHTAELYLCYSQENMTLYHQIIKP